MMRCVDQSTLQVSPLVVHKQSLFSSQSLKAESPYVQHCHNFLKLFFTLWRREQGIWIVESNVVGHCSHHHHHHHHHRHCLHCDCVITLIIIIVIISRCHHYHCCHNYPPPTDISVVVKILFQLIFIFPLFLCMVMYANEFKTKEKQKLTATYPLIIIIAILLFIWLNVPNDRPRNENSSLQYLFLSVDNWTPC